MENSIEPYLEFSDGIDFIRFEEIKATFPDAAFEWDRNSLTAKIEVKAGNFSGNFVAELMTHDFQYLKNQFENLTDQLISNIQIFKPLEQQIILTATGDGLGHFEMECKVTPDNNSRQTLTFYLQFDQSDIKCYVLGLEKVIRTFSK